MTSLNLNTFTHLHLAIDDGFDGAEFEDEVRAQEFAGSFVSEGRSMILEVETMSIARILLSQKQCLPTD